MTYTVAPDTGRVTGVNDFRKQNTVDKVVAFTTATHEGQLFGRLNQAILVLTAASLLLVSISAVVMWWTRRPAHRLGAPSPVARPRFSAVLAVTIIALALLLPLFGLPLVLILVIDLSLLRRLPAAQRWLGLEPAAI